MGHKTRKIVVKSMMYISSYFPLYILLSVLIIPKILEGTYNYDSTIILFVAAILIAFIFITIISMWLFFIIKPSNYCETKNIEYADDKVMDYVCTYLMPVLSLDVNDVYSVIVNALYFTMMWILYIRLNLIFLNPLLATFGYIAYKHDGGYIITNIPLEKIRQSCKILHGTYLVNGVFVACNKYN